MLDHKVPARLTAILAANVSSIIGVLVIVALVFSRIGQGYGLGKGQDEGSSCEAGRGTARKERRWRLSVHAHRRDLRGPDALRRAGPAGICRWLCPGDSRLHHRSRTRPKCDSCRRCSERRRRGPLHRRTSGCGADDGARAGDVVRRVCDRGGARHGGYRLASGPGNTPGRGRLHRGHE